MNVQSGVAIGTMSGIDRNKQELLKCKWSNCEKKHENEITYPNDGNVNRGASALRDNLIAKSDFPWNSAANYNGPTDREIYLKHSDGTIGVRKKLRADGLQYAIEAHHLVAVESMEKTKTLKKNAKLAGWDIDDASNGMNCPEFPADIAVNEVPHHSGGHLGSYFDHIRGLLKTIEDVYAKKCINQESSEFSKNLVLDLQRASTKIKKKILAIRGQRNFWALYDDSLAAFNESIDEYHRRHKKFIGQDGSR